jgi:hypothetical protein
VPKKIPPLLTVCDWAACFKFSIATFCCHLEVKWIQEGCQRDGNLIRFIDHSIHGYYMARFLFQYKSWSQRALIVLVYNPQITPVELAAEAVGSEICIIQPNSYVVAKGLTLEPYDVNRTPLRNEIQWGDQISLVFVEVEKNVFGGELMLNVDMRVKYSSRGGYN